MRWGSADRQGAEGGRVPAIGRLEEHPNLIEILGVLAQLAHVADDHLPRLAQRWTNTVAVAEARDKALSPDSPLVCEVLTCFEAVTHLFEDDIRAEAPYIHVDPQVALRGLKAVRDAVAAAYARPVLSRLEHELLLRPWRSVYPLADAREEPDLGPRSEQVKLLLAALPGLSTRCHDPQQQARWDALVDSSFVEEGDRSDARASAFSAAVLTSRRRTWALVRRSGSEGLGRSCGTCRTPRPPGSERDQQRVSAVCLDAACALLVADAVPDAVLDLLLQPVSRLIPLQRDGSS